GLKLYVKRVFISDDDKELLPTYLRFVRGIIDVEDLPLNVSREILQENKILKSVQEASVKKILAELKKFKEKDKENYLKFHENFGKVLKEGLYGFGENKDAIAKLLYFKNSNKEELIDLEEYKQNLAQDQKEIFYITGKNEKILRNSPLLESYKQKNINVLLLDEEIDTIVMPMMNEFEGLKFSAINHLASEETSEEQKAEFAPLLIKIKEALKDEVEEVKLSQRLSNSPSCIVYDQNKPDFAMQQILKQMGQEQQVKPILEINPNHEILKALKENDALANDMAHILLNMAKLSEGMGIDNPNDFNNALNKIVSKALEK
ncbi:TPA: molecular chaperone HtpG, partial [Campylobacter lari]|nr:molecular chaperone HtpG [Campylobacter lari]